MLHLIIHAVLVLLPLAQAFPTRDWAMAQVRQEWLSSGGSECLSRIAAHEGIIPKDAIKRILR